MDANISDIFFNMDHASAVLHDAKGQFNGLNEAELLSDATDLLGSLERLGVFDLPTPAELVANYYRRL